MDSRQEAPDGFSGMRAGAVGFVGQWPLHSKAELEYQVGMLAEKQPDSLLERGEDPFQAANGGVDHRAGHGAGLGIEHQFDPLVGRVNGQPGGAKR